jgi:hypothetical protein
LVGWCHQQSHRFFSRLHVDNQQPVGTYCHFVGLLYRFCVGYLFDSKSCMSDAMKKKKQGAYARGEGGFAAPCPGNERDSRVSTPKISMFQ